MDTDRKHDYKVIFTEFAVLFIFLLPLGFLYVSQLKAEVPPKTGMTASLAAVTTNTSAPQITPDAPKKDPFFNLNLEGKAAYVVDATTGKPIFAMNENQPFALASLTKVMTTITAAETMPLDGEVIIGANALSRDGDTGLLLNERWKLVDLLNFSLIVSSNDGMAAVAYAVDNYVTKATFQQGNSTEHFIQLMNETAQKIGMTTSVFMNESGLDVTNTVNGGTASAKDAATMFRYALEHYGTLFQGTTKESSVITSLDGIKHDAENTNTIVGKIPGLIASKTGYTDLAGGNLMVEFDAGVGHPVIAVVLGSTEEGRFRDIAKLTNATLQSLSGLPEKAF